MSAHSRWPLTWLQAFQLRHGRSWGRGERVSSSFRMGDVCTGASPSPCQDSKDCCSDRFGNKATCYQLLSGGGPNPYSKPACDGNCDSDSDCDDVYGPTTGYCCLPVPAKEMPGGPLAYFVLGTPNGTKTCNTRKFDARCTRVPTTTQPGPGGGGSSCDYSGCVKACTEAGGSNCGEDCKCP